MKPAPGKCDVLITLTELDGGGTGRYAEDLAVGLAQRGVSVALLLDSGSTDRARYLKSVNVPIIQMKVRESWTGTRYGLALREAIRILQPRVVHANAWLRHAEIVKSAIACNLPVIFTGHSTPPRPRLREWLGVNRSPFGLYRERALFSSAAVICISKLALENLKLRIRSRLSAVAIYNGVPLIQLPSEPAGISDRLSIVWVGSLIERKRPLLAIKVFEHVLRQHPHAQLHIIGDGPLMSAVRSAASLLPEGSVVITGFSNSAIDVLLRGDVYLQTSAAEGLPYTVLEAMSVGLPTVVTNVGATREAVVHGETGLLCKIDNLPELSGAVNQMLISSTRRALFGQRGIQRVRQTFSMDRMITETVCAYRNLLGVDLVTSSRVA